MKKWGSGVGELSRVSVSHLHKYCQDRRTGSCCDVFLLQAKRGRMENSRIRPDNVGFPGGKSLIQTATSGTKGGAEEVDMSKFQDVMCGGFVVHTV